MSSTPTAFEADRRRAARSVAASIRAPVWRPSGSVQCGTRCPRHGATGSPRWSRDGRVEQVTLLAGVIAVTADADRLRRLAVEAARLPDWWYRGQSFLRLDHPAGEVQIWREYHRMVSIARTARAEVLADPDAASGEPGVVRERIWRRGAAVRRRRYAPPTSG